MSEKMDETYRQAAPPDHLWLGIDRWASRARAG